MSIVLRLEKEALKFSAAHFLIFADGSAERLHGHNYRVRAQVSAERSSRGLVVDFGTLKEALRAVLCTLDESFLVAGNHPEVTVSTADATGSHAFEGGPETVVQYRHKRYSAPADEVRVLPIENTSVEELAAYVADRWMDELLLRTEAGSFNLLRVEVEETPGQRARVTRRRVAPPKPSAHPSLSNSPSFSGRA